MKQLRIRAIEGMTEALWEDCIHLMRLSRDDEALQDAYGIAMEALRSAKTRAAKLLEERTSD